MASGLDLYIVTFNCGRTPVDYDHFAAHLFEPYNRRANDKFPDLVVLCLEELAPLAYSFLGGSFLSYYFARFLQAVQRAAGEPGQYRHLVTHNVGMTGVLVFAKTEITPHVRWIQTGHVRVGDFDLGNKGAAGVRIGYAADEESEPVPLTFIAAHLAPMENAVDRRNADWENIVRGLSFGAGQVEPAPSQQDESEPLLGKSDVASQHAIFTNQSPVFFAGDLNYRISDQSPGPEDYTSFPQPRSNRDDPKHFSHFLPKDQLNRERQAGKTLHLLSEADIDFPPTYKFSTEQQKQVAKGVTVDDAHPDTWMWSAHRYPSWCDRILFSSYLVTSNAFRPLEYLALPLQSTSDHRPVALAGRLDLTALQKADKTQKPPFELDRNWAMTKAWARRLEVTVGVAAYLGWTWEGNGLLLATTVGAFGGWLVMQSLVAS